MANLNSKALDSYDAFPELPIRLVGGDEVTAPGCLGPDYGVFLIYRGSW